MELEHGRWVRRASNPLVLAANPKKSAAQIAAGWKAAGIKPVIVKNTGGGLSPAKVKMIARASAKAAAAQVAKAAKPKKKPKPKRKGWGKKAGKLSASARASAPFRRRMTGRMVKKISSMFAAFQPKKKPKKKSGGKKVAKKKSKGGRRTGRKAARSKVSRKTYRAAKKKGKTKGHYVVYKGRGRRPKFRIFRRTNPFSVSQILNYVRVGVAGGLGIVAARFGGNLYKDKVSSHVLKGSTDPKSFRSILNDALYLVSMGGFTLAVNEVIVRRVDPADSLFFTIGGLAETGRQAVGIVAKRLKPDYNARRWGLDGMGAAALPYVQYSEPGDGYIYGASSDGQWFRIGTSSAGGLSGLIDPSEQFDGLQPEDSFGYHDMDEDAID